MADGLKVFDGDGWTVTDTPPDDGGAVIARLNGGNPCGLVDSVEIKVEGQAKPYVLRPDRGNVMSYFGCNLAHFSAGQSRTMQNALEKLNRRHLIVTHGWRLDTLRTTIVGGALRYTAVWRQTGGGEIQVYGWAYEDYRRKYDELWNQGWRLKILDAFVLDGGKVRYNAVWRPSTQGEIQVYGWKYEDYRAEYAHHLVNMGCVGAPRCRAG